MSMFILRLSTFMSLLSSPYSSIGLYTSSLSSDPHIAFTNFPWFPFRGQSNSVVDKIVQSLSSSSLSYNNNDDDDDDDNDGNNELYRILIFRSLDSKDHSAVWVDVEKLRCVVGRRLMQKSRQKHQRRPIVLRYCSHLCSMSSRENRGVQNPSEMTE